MHLGVGEPGVRRVSDERGDNMRVSVYKLEDGAMAVLVEASPGKGFAPVLTHGVTPANVTELVRPVIDRMRRPKQPRRSRDASKDGQNGPDTP